MNLNILRDYENHIGKILFLISIIILVYLFFNPAMGCFFNIDEQFTLAIINLPFSQAWNLIVNDVHPPLYYLILLAFKGLFNTLHVSINLLYLSKLLSLLPLVLLMLISCTKIRGEYGWLACGVFMFGITTMSNISEIFITGRMYSWSVLFLVLAFIAYMGVLKTSGIKSWILLTLFTVLCLYTHYILVFPLFIMYLAYFLYISYNDEVDKKSEKRKAIASIVVSVLCYIPWIFTLIRQVSAINRTYIHTAKLSGDVLVNYLTCFVLQDTKQLLDLVFWKFLVFVLLILIIVAFILEIKNFKNHEAFAIFSGINIYIFTILLASFFVTFIFKGITVRYFVAVIAVFWLTIAILLSRIKDYRILLIALILILALGVHGINTTVNDINYHNRLGLEQNDIINDINKPDNIIIYNGTYNTYHFLLNNTEEYSLRDYNGENGPSYIVEEDLSAILDDYPDRNVYLVGVLYNVTGDDVKINDNVTASKLSQQGRTYIMKLNRIAEAEENSTDTTSENVTG